MYNFVHQIELFLTVGVKGKSKKNTPANTKHRGIGELKLSEEKLLCICLIGMPNKN